MGRIEGDELKAEVAFPRCISADGMRRMSQAFVLSREQCRVALGEKKIPTGFIYSPIGPTAESAGKRIRGRKSSAFDLISSFSSFKSFSSFSICYRSNNLLV